MKPSKWIVWIIAAIAAVTPLFIKNTYVINLMVLTTIYCVLASAWNFVSGFAGQFGFSGVFFALGAYKRIRGAAGLIGLLGTDNIVEVEKRIAAGDEYAAVVLEAMAYQIAKEIGACVAALEGRVDAIGLTGGIAYSAFIMNHIKKRVSAFAPILEYPGECENEALALGAYRVVSGQEQALTLD